MQNSIIRLTVSAILAVGALLLFSAPTHAQIRNIKGVVADEDGNPIPGATIRIEATDTHRPFPPSRTNQKGEFQQLLGNQAGIYRVTVRKEGFRPDVKDNVRPEIDDYGRAEIIVNFKLVPGNHEQKFGFEMTAEEKKEAEQRYGKQEDAERLQKMSREIRSRFEKGIGLFDTGQYEDAITEFNAVLEKDPKQPGVLARVGDSYLKLNKNQEAVEAYDRALEIDNAVANVYAQKGVALSNMGKTDESQEMFRISSELDPKGAAQSFYNLGATLYNAGDMIKAADAFKQSIEADPNYAESYYLLGMCLSGDESTFAAAVDAFKRYVAIGMKVEQVDLAREIIPVLGGELSF